MAGTAPGPRHRADGEPQPPAVRAGLAWPLVAIGIVGVAGAHALSQSLRNGEGLLAAEAFTLLDPHAHLPVRAFSPHGVGAVHLAVYATLTRAFDRYTTLAAAGREFVLVCMLLSAVLLWCISRRLGLGGMPSAVGALLAGAVPLVWPLTAPDSPALVAVPWLLLAAYLLARGGPTPAVLAVALLSSTVAVLLAPGTLLLLLAGAAAAAITGTLPRRVPGAGRAVLAVVATSLFVAVAVLLGRWAPLPDTAAGEAAVRGPPVLGVAAALLVVGALAAPRLPRFRAAAAALVATTVAALVVPGGLSALYPCLALGAFLTAALTQRLARSVLTTRVRLRRIAQAATALLVAATAVTALVGPARMPHPDLGARDHDALLSWSRAQLSPDSRLVAPVRLWAELVHAGGREDQFRLPGTAGRGSPLAPVVRASEDGAPGDVLVARFGRSSSAPPLLVLDPARHPPTTADLERRRTLATALLANPATSAGAQATRVLESGRVDPRLLAILAALAGQFGLGLDSLPPAPGESLRHTPAREAVISSVAGRPLMPGLPVTDSLVAYLNAQLPPFAPDHVEAARDGVHVAFHYVSAPDDLVSGATP